MKTINLIKLILSIIAITSFMLLLKSCKKADIGPPQNTKTAEATRAAALQAIKAQYGDVSAGVVYNINKSATDYFYKDANGQRVSLYGAGNGKPGIANGPNLCTYTCSTAPNASDLTINYNLDYVERFYKCESTTQSEVNVKWTVSVPFFICGICAGSTSSNGYVQFTDAFSTVTTFSVLYTDMAITHIGPDPNCATNDLFTVTYKIDNIPNSNFASGTTIAAAIDLANNCRLTSNIVSSGYVNGPTFSQDGYLPCNRIDKVYVNLNTGPSNCATATGNYVICSYPGGSFSPINYHEVEYRIVTSGSSLLWDNQTSTVFWGEPTGTSTPDEKLNPSTGVSNLVNMTPSSGTWLVRYKNIKTSVCNLIYSGGTNPSPGPPNANGDWLNPALWVVEVWIP